MSNELPKELTCGHPVPKPQGLGTGYARFDDGAILCYPCSDERIREELKATPVKGSYHLYISDGKVTSWSGGVFGTVVSSREDRERVTPTGGWWRPTHVNVSMPGFGAWEGTYNADRGNLVKLTRWK